MLRSGEVIIVDEFTGRLWSRRYSDGLHQAIEARKCSVANENQTLASAYQNYFRMYNKICGRLERQKPGR